MGVELAVLPDYKLNKLCCYIGTLCFRLLDHPALGYLLSDVDWTLLCPLHRLCLPVPDDCRSHPVHFSNPLVTLAHPLFYPRSIY